MTLSGETHVCSAGETFDSIALVEYEDEKYAADLLNANPSYCRTLVFTGGEVLLLPVVEAPEDEEDEDVDEDDYVPAVAPWKE